MNKKIKIALIEDDADDVELLRDALENHNVSYSMIVLKDGSAASAFCHDIQPDQLPDIIVMDFNLPRVHGRELIQLIRCKSHFADIPILILSTSSSKEDIAFAYNVGANKYLVKPVTLQAIQETVHTIVTMAKSRSRSVV